MYEKELQNLGLSEKEAKVYTTALELGPDTAQNIAKTSGINRATTYVQIDSLVKRGLMSEFEKGKKTFYVAESPNRLKNLVSAIEKELALKKAEASTIIPELISLFEGMGDRPKVKFFEGMEGYRAEREEFLKTKTKMIYGIIDYDKLFHFYPDQQGEYTNIRAKKGIKTKVLYASKTVVKDANSKEFLREAKHIPASKLDLQASITLYDNKIAISTYSINPTSVVIESDVMAKTCRSLFELFWSKM